MLDARIALPEAALTREGFVLVNQVTVVSDFYADQQVEGIYLRNSKRLSGNNSTMCSMRKCLTTRVAPVRKTCAGNANCVKRQRLYTTIFQPFRYPHRDEYFERNAEARETLADKPFAIINVWRSTNGVIQQKPLAICDALSVEPEDFIAVTRQTKNHVGELQLAVYNPEQCWYYYPGMDMDEALVFKTFDSRADGRSRYILHSAFDLPDTTAATPIRESIEARCLVFFSE